MYESLDVIIAFVSLMIDAARQGDGWEGKGKGGKEREEGSYGKEPVITIMVLTGRRVWEGGSDIVLIIIAN